MKYVIGIILIGLLASCKDYDICECYHLDVKDKRIEEKLNSEELDYLTECKKKFSGSDYEVAHEECGESQIIELEELEIKAAN